MKDFGRLRDIRANELELMRTWRNDPMIRARMFNQHEIGLDEHRVWWARVQQRADQKYLMYEYQGAASGIVSLTHIDHASGNASWGFYLSPNARRGLGACMEFLTLEYGFNTLRLHKLYGDVLASNGPGLNIQKKFGFRVEGVFREQYKKGEEFIDVYRFGLLAREWAIKKPELAKRVAAVVK
jgi:UDP-4-amino-4,6-dideoxy-N-acetyl-beta-L-altrosamine N-acetyltransferase